MIHSDFIIDQTFICGEREWKVTDIGTRTVIAVLVSGVPADWLTGPPYAVSEVVFDENDFEGCTITE